MGTRRTTGEVVLLSSLAEMSNLLFDKSLLGSLTMQYKPPITSTTSFPILSLPKQFEIPSKNIALELLSREKSLYSRRLIGNRDSTLLSTIKTGL